MHVFFSICFTQMSMFSFHILFLNLLLQKMEDFCLFYALASMIFYSRSCIVCNVFISDIFEMFYAFLCILCILIQGTMVEQLCLNGFTLYKYICNKKNLFILNTIIQICSSLRKSMLGDYKQTFYADSWRKFHTPRPNTKWTSME